MLKEEKLDQYEKELEAELKDILRYWQQNMVDEKLGGFLGRVDCFGRVDPAATKSAVLNTRILWTFSAVVHQLRKTDLILIADRAFSYINEHFIDQIYGGIYWSVDHKGVVNSSRKQIYAQAFAVYAFSEYHLASGNFAAKKTAIHLFQLIERHAYDPIYGGYVEALSEKWEPLDDMRLSEKDANEKKSMNTHLHVLEAYSNLYKIWPDLLLQQRLKELLQIFATKIVDSITGHQHLFFGDDWSIRSSIISFGHDIETSWLIMKASEVLNDKRITSIITSLSKKMSHATLKGLDKSGGLNYEYLPEQGIFNREKHWWPQAEAMVGFFHAFEHTKEIEWLNKSLGIWDFVKTHIKDPINGEWHWGIDESGMLMEREDKAGFWKCPYHNSRACLEILKGIKRIRSRDH